MSKCKHNVLELNDGVPTSKKTFYDEAIVKQVLITAGLFSYTYMKKHKNAKEKDFMNYMDEKYYVIMYSTLSNIPEEDDDEDWNN